MINYSAFFDRMQVISLRRREDRRDAFHARLKKVRTADGASRPWVVRWFWAFDGATIPKPAGHNPPPGAFGCALSHLVAWATALNGEELENEPLLFFEDDAYLCDEFFEKLATALPLVPDDWDILYLGGEILAGRPQPEIVAEGHDVKVGKVSNVNRLHAYAVKASAMTRLFPRMLAYLSNAPQRTGPSGEESCFDYEVGRMSEDGTLKAYCVVPWLVGQRNMGSDTSPNGRNDIRDEAVRFF